MWETSGAAARSIMTRMPLSGGTVTRVDLQQTVLLSAARPQFGTHCLQLAETTPNPRLLSGRPVGLQSRSNGAWCGLVNDRDAPEYFRLYDKGTESKSHGRGLRWRLELEVKYSHADALWRRHREDLMDPQWLASYLKQRWLSQGCCWPIAVDVDDAAPVKPEPSSRPTLGALAVWMHRTVRPVVVRLLKVYTVNEVLQMLELDLVAQPIRRLDADRD